MSFGRMSGLDRSSLTLLLLTAMLPVALMIACTSARAQQVVGASGMNGANCFTGGCAGGNGADGQSVTANGTSVSAFGGAGGGGGTAREDDDNGLDTFGGNGGNGGAASATAADAANATGGPGGDGGSAFVCCGPDAFGFGGNGGNGGAASASGTNATAVGGAGGAAGDFQLVGSGGVAGNGGDADAGSSAISSGSSNATSAATANGGAGGDGISEGAGVAGSGAGGNATAASSATANGSGNAISSATSTGGAGGFGFSQPGNATATSSATAKGSGSATASATATLDFNNGFSFEPAENATSYAETAEGGLAQAQAQVQGNFDVGESQSSAKTTFGGVSVQSTVESFGGGATNAIAQGGSGQSPVNSGQSAFAFSAALPNTAYASTLIGSASNVADALLGPDDKIFGTALLGGFDSSSTFDFSFGGDLILGVIAGGFIEIVANGADIFSENVGDNSVINLGSIFGPNIDLTIEGDGVFAFGGAVPEPSTWAMMLAGFAGLGFLGYRSTGGARGSSRTLATRKRSTESDPHLHVKRH
jgi:PEP-CTERM motif